MARKVSDFVTELADREAIRDCLFRYARSIDRLDLALAETFYWPEATDNHGVISGKVSEFFAFAEPIFRQLELTQHCLGNILIEIDGSEARVETYLIASHIFKVNENRVNIMIGARLLDVLHKREDEWRLFERRVLHDWIKSDPNQPTWFEEKLPEQFLDGRRKPDDPSGSLFKRM